MGTIRQQIMDLLMERECSAREVSQLLKIREKDVYDHLAHIRHSLSAQSLRLTVVPARCLQCNYSFQDRHRVSKPGRCPRCRGEQIQSPTYRVEEPGGRRFS